MAYLLDCSTSNAAGPSYEERLRRATQHGPFVVFEQDRELRYTWVHNPQLGFTVEGLLGKRDAEFLSPEDAALVTQIKRRVLETGVRVREEVCVTLNGERRCFDLSVEPLLDAASGVIGIGCTAVDITERNRAIEVLRESEATNRALLDALPDGVFRIRRDGAYLDFHGSKEFATLVPPSAFLGKKVTEILPAELAQRSMAHIERALETGEIQIFRYSLPIDGALGHYEARIVVSGKDEVLTIVRDVTDLRLAEERLQEAHQTLQALIQAAPLAVVASDQDAKVKIWNPAAERTFGYSEQEVLGRRVPIVPEDKQEEFLAGLRLITKGRTLSGVETQRLKKDGSRLDVALSAAPLRDAAGQIVGSMGIVEDITERRKIQERLRQSEERFALFMEHMPAVAFMKDLQGSYVYVNREVEKLSDRRGADWIGKTDKDIWPEAAAQITQVDRAVLESGRAVESIESVPMQGRPHFFQSVKFPVRSADGAMIMVGGIGVDITEKKRADEALGESHRLLEQNRGELRALAARLLTAQEEERRRVSRELHDDLNQKLAILALEVGTLIKTLPSSAGLLRDQLRALQNRVVNVSEDVRHIAYQLHPSILDDLGLAVALRSYCEEFSHREGIAVRFAHRRLPDLVPQDVASCLYRVAQESLRNVAKHACAKQASVTIAGSDDSIRLSIKDAGVGFDAASHKTGSGLGIVSMEERVRLINGSFSIHSRPGHGTEVEVRIPLAEVSR